MKEGRDEQDEFKGSFLSLKPALEDGRKQRKATLSDRA